MNLRRAGAAGRPRSRRTPRGGFTLIELLVAIAITAILLVIVLQSTTSLLHTWSRQRNILRKNLDARAAIELMAGDLRAMVIRQRQFTPAAEWVDKQTDTSITGVGSYLSSGNAAWLMFFTVPIDRDLTLPGDVCAVSYRLGYEDPIAGSSGRTYPLMGLYRDVAPAGTASADTFGSVLGLADLYGGYWNSGSRTLKSANFLIAHIIDFQVIFHAQNPDGSAVDIPASATVRLGDALTATPAPSGLNASAKLTSVDVLITLLSEETAMQLRQITDPTVQKRLVQQNAQSFARRIAVSY